MSQPDLYPIPARTHRVEEAVQRSRFIATLAHAADADAARAFIDAIRAELPDATHHCWAFVAGRPGSTRAIGMSDAGEPRGTAGRPMLEVLLHSGVGEIVAVVTRYFGGTKLGKGGLARAYARAVQRALETLPRVQSIERVRMRLALDYGAVDAARRVMAEEGVVVERETYGDEAAYDVAVDAARAEAFAERLAAVTGGRARIERVA